MYVPLCFALCFVRKDIFSIVVVVLQTRLTSTRTKTSRESQFIIFQCAIMSLWEWHSSRKKLYDSSQMKRVGGNHFWTPIIHSWPTWILDDQTCIILDPWLPSLIVCSPFVRYSGNQLRFKWDKWDNWQVHRTLVESRISNSACWDRSAICDLFPQ
jgi:hypothetical protein